MHTNLEGKLLVVGSVGLHELGEQEDTNAMRSSVEGATTLVLDRVGVEHLTASDDVRDEVEIPAKVRIAEVSENSTVNVHPLHVV